MIVHEGHTLFQDRADAGKQLSERLRRYRNGEVIVFAIPRGGVPVAIEVARELNSSLDVITPHKITIPYNPEAAGSGIVYI